MRVESGMTVNRTPVKKVGRYFSMFKTILYENH